MLVHWYVGTLVHVCSYVPLHEQVMSSFSVASSKDPIRDLPLSSVFSTSDSEQKMVKELIDDCYLHHKRSFFGSLPPETSKLTKNSAGAA